MNYNKLVIRLRQRAFDYKGEKDIQFSRILKEAVQRKIKQQKQTKQYAKMYAMQQESLLFITR